MLSTRCRERIDRPIRSQAIGAGASGQSQQGHSRDHRQQLHVGTSLKQELTFHLVTVGPTCARRYGSHVPFRMTRSGYFDSTRLRAEVCNYRAVATEVLMN
jgi:hypothetical protein